MTRRSFALVAAIALVAATASAFSLIQSTTDALDPVRVAPDTHKVAFENAFVRVLEVHIPPGSIEPRHRHPHGLSVYFSDWQAKVTVDGKEAVVNQRKTGSFAWSEAVIHTVQNVGPTEGHVVRIELKYLASPSDSTRDTRAPLTTAVRSSLAAAARRSFTASPP